MTVTLDIPDEIRFQLVYRLKKDQPFGTVLDSGFEFLFLDSIKNSLSRMSALMRCCGRAGAAKAVAKLASGRRSMYVITHRGDPVSYGWCTAGRCKHYKIEPEAVVIGPIWTSPQSRGRGLATKALQMAIDAHVARGVSLFYIDTEKLNFPAQRVFEKCEFGAPVALYFR